MKFELFIAKRLIGQNTEQKSVSRSMVTISVAGIALGMAIMILSIAIVTGFNNEIKNKVAGFGAHITITNYDANSSFETLPIALKQPFYPSMNKMDGIRHIQPYSIKAGIIKSKTDMQGVVLKGVSSDYDWTFFRKNLLKGNIPRIEKGSKSKEILISEYLSNLLQYKIGDTLTMYFVQNPPRIRKFQISGIFDTNLEDVDKMFVYCDMAHVQRLNSWGTDSVTGFEVLIDKFDQLDEMTDKVFAVAGNIYDKSGGKLNVTNLRMNYPQVFEWLVLVDRNVWVILVIMTIVAGINMCSGLLILILERINTIGVLKALGCTNKSIKQIFLFNGMYLVLKGIVIGNLLGTTLCLIQKYFELIHLNPSTYYVSSVPINLKLTHLLLLNAGTILVSFLILMLPALIISNIRPIKAIRFN